MAALAPSACVPATALGAGLLLWFLMGTATQDLCLARIPSRPYGDQNCTGEDPARGGDITIGNAYRLLPFANTLVDLTMTGAEIRQVLNEAVDYADSDSSGAYPYAAGLRWTVDMNRAAGERLYDIQVRGRDATEWRALTEVETLNVVTNSFTAGGGDGYVTFETVSDDGRAVDTFLEYAQSFVDYTMEVGTLSKPRADEYSTQSFTPAP